MVSATVSPLTVRVPRFQARSLSVNLSALRASCATRCLALCLSAAETSSITSTLPPAFSIASRALFDTPVVFLPQSAILGTGVVYKKPIVVSQDGLDAIAIRSTVFLALSYDHRIIDGADASRFLVTMKQRLETGAFEANLGI